MDQESLGSGFDETLYQPTSNEHAGDDGGRDQLGVSRFVGISTHGSVHDGNDYMADDGITQETIQRY